jgi:hypothetical protein
MSFEKLDTPENNNLEKVSEKSVAPDSKEIQLPSPNSGQEQKFDNRNTWAEYLDKTGNPMLEEMKREAGAFSREGLVGNLEGVKNISPQGAEALKLSHERQMNLAADFLFDASVSDELLEKATYTGDLKSDAQNLFQSIRARRALERLRGGEDPRSLLNEAAQTADTLSQNIKNNEALQKSAYTIIKIKKAIERILAGSK